MRALLVALAVATFAAGPWPAEAAQPSKFAAKDSAEIQDCIKSKPGKEEACIGIVSEPCLNRDETKSTADMNACVDRELAVWDDILNETFRRLRDKLDAQQKEKLRDMQRAWIVSKEKTCAFYWDYFQGTMASPMAASCVNRETARRALFLLGFLVDADSSK
ncbi:lysozyme inhibitor LprI family protein [Pseudolabrys taiwanensis]|nr:lysozyme inhibitor LprI family protein [Pseudolabrys taiwanensis]